jgi:hypothetical protein
VQAAPDRLPQGTDRHQVARADDRRRRVGSAEQLGERAAAALDRERRVRDEVVRVEAGGAKRGRATGCLQLRRQVVLEAGDVADPLVAELEQVRRGDLAGGALVDADRGDVEPVQRAVDEDEPRALRDELRVVAVVAAEVRHLRGDEDHSLHPPVEEHVHVIDLAEGGLARVAEDRGEPVGRRARLDRLGERREDRVRELRDEDADQARLRAAARRHVEEFAHRPFDALPRLRPHRQRTARDPRRGCDAHSRPVGDIPQGRHVPDVCNSFQRPVQARAGRLAAHPQAVCGESAHLPPPP